MQVRIFYIFIDTLTYGDRKSKAFKSDYFDRICLKEQFELIKRKYPQFSTISYEELIKSYFPAIYEKKYDKNRGPFLIYFLSAWKREYSHIASDRQIEERLHGMKISEDDRRNVVRYVQFINSVGTNLDIMEIIHRLSDAIGISVEDIERIAAIEKTTVTSDIAVDSEGNEFCLWDQLESEDSSFDELDGAEEVSALADEIEAVFSQLQERQKPIMSELLTARLCRQFPYQVLKQWRCCFLNDEIIETFHITGTIPSQKNIADKYGKKEASVSRTMRDFCRKIDYIKRR